MQGLGFLCVTWTARPFYLWGFFLWLFFKETQTTSKEEKNSSFSKNTIRSTLLLFRQLPLLLISQSKMCRPARQGEGKVDNKEERGRGRRKKLEEGRNWQSPSRGPSDHAPSLRPGHVGHEERLQALGWEMLFNELVTSVLILKGAFT